MCPGQRLEDENVYYENARSEPYLTNEYLGDSTDCTREEILGHICSAADLACLFQRVGHGHDFLTLERWSLDFAVVVQSVQWAVMAISTTCSDLVKTVIAQFRIDCFASNSPFRALIANPRSLLITSHNSNRFEAVQQSWRETSEGFAAKRQLRRAWAEQILPLAELQQHDLDSRSGQV